MRAAAAITSITMNGGTSLRAEGLIKRRAASNISSVLSIVRARPAPLSPHFYAEFASYKVPQSDLNRVDRPAAHH